MPSGCARSSNNRVQPRRGCSPDVVYIRSREARAHEFLCTLEVLARAAWSSRDDGFCVRGRESLK